MNPRVHVWSALLLTAVFAAAQKPPARPPKTDDTAALEDAIRAVDRAKEKTEPAKKADPTPADTDTKPAKPATPAPAAKAPPSTKPAKSKPDGPATQTQITGLEDAELDNARNIIIFRKNVIVDRPDLKIWCDQLEIALNRSQTKPATTRPAPEKKDEEPDAFSAETIKSATATASAGGLVVIWRKTETGDSVAVGRKAVYTAGDGAFTITGLPEVLENMTHHFYSLGEADKMTMLKNSARGSKKVNLNLSTVRAKEIRQRLFSHVPGRRPAEATAPGEAAPAPAPSGGDTPPPPLPAAPPATSSPGN